MYVIGTGTQYKAKVTLQQKELEDGIVGLTAHLEPFLTALKKKPLGEDGHWIKKQRLGGNKFLGDKKHFKGGNCHVPRRIRRIIL